MNLPNKLTLLRVLLIPIFLLFLLGKWPMLSSPLNQWLAIVIFIVASLTDFLDGYIARSQNLVTTFGKFADPLADKLLVASALVAMVELNYIGAWVAIIIISREFIVTGFRLVAAEKKMVIAAGIWGKMKTVVTMIMIIFVLFQFPGLMNMMVRNVLVFLSLLLTIISMVEYMGKNISILKDSEV